MIIEYKDGLQIDRSEKEKTQIIILYLISVLLILLAIVAIFFSIFLKKKSKLILDLHNAKEKHIITKYENQISELLKKVK